jgi:hypothetical protein
LTSLGLAYLAASAPQKTGSVMQDTVQSAPVLPATPVTDGTASGNTPAGTVTTPSAEEAPSSKAKDIPQ